MDIVFIINILKYSLSYHSLKVKMVIHKRTWFSQRRINVNSTKHSKRLIAELCMNVNSTIHNKHFFSNYIWTLIQHVWDCDDVKSNTLQRLTKRYNLSNILSNVLCVYVIRLCRLVYNIYINIYIYKYVYKMKP